MADPLLTSLCTICHTQSPKYKCPRCGMRTCSLTCVKKHKNWSSCNGERDPTIYIPRRKLKTDAGIDHDYNFLTKIERSVEQTEKILREEKDILPQDDLASRPRPNKRRRIHNNSSRAIGPFDESTRKWDRNSIPRMLHLGINVSSLPYGMARAKENTTSWNKRTRTMNWQVEWLEWNAIGSPDGNYEPKPSRMLHKILDEVPLYVGFADGQESRRQQQLSSQERAVEKRQKKTTESKSVAGSGQDAITTSWSSGEHVMQDSTTTMWKTLALRPHTTDELGDRYRFFYLLPKTPSREPQRLIPLRPTENLATILPGLDIVEFPTICVLPSGSERVPDGYVVESRPKKSKKRGAPELVEYSSDGEDGEVMDQDSEQGGKDDTTSSSGSDSSEESD
ncbi:hypothetical protein GGR54DRAFT_582971 [Hypoxylon sp. NC1633]|nr:hypothetical protein GGR54DRAFT_582971 [Hypoxylon sp. NC1633]